ncbi:MAG: hypothetical protein H7315_05605 [Herminiimonas sp.]|nr:hypothetical protein [Herminiimonas sp.]
MKSYRIPLFASVAFAVVVVSACGGGSNNPVTVSPSTDTAALFTAKFNAVMSAFGTSSGLTSKAVVDAFDEKYLDMAFAKADVLASLTTTSQAFDTDPTLSLFPMGQVTNASVTSCDANNICTLNATLTNSDVDTTSVDFTTKVKVISGVVYLYGDQSATTSI